MVKRSDVIIVIASVVAFLALAAVITLIVLWLTIFNPFQDYAIVIDAGSTHTSIFLYTWSADKSDGLGTTSRIKQVRLCDVPKDPVSLINISAPNGVKDYFNTPMMECINAIPENRRYRTLIFLGATAGLRLLNMSNPTYTMALLEGIRAYFSSLGLLFRAPETQVRIISGGEEGIAGWTSANILMGQLFPNRDPVGTYGVLDMGGASTQITFLDPSATSERYTLNLFDRNYEVYSYSYLCYGQQQMRLVYQGQLIQQANGSAVIDDPCLQTGFNQTIQHSTINASACNILRYTAPTNFTRTTNITYRGTGNYSECQRLIRARLSKSSCSSRSNCSFDGVYQPIPIPSSLKIIAMSAYHSVFNTLAPFLSLSPDASKNYDLSSINFTRMNTILEGICSQPWSNVSNISEADRGFRPYLCFNGMYHWNLLEYGYSMNNMNLRNFQIIDTINSNKIGWTLGYMINQTNYLDAQFLPDRLLTHAEFIGILVCFIVLLVISLFLIVLTIIIHCRRRRTSGKKL